MVGVAVGQLDAVAGGLRVEEQPGLGAVIAGGHAQLGAGGVGQALGLGGLAGLVPGGGAGLGRGIGFLDLDAGAAAGQKGSGHHDGKKHRDQGLILFHDILLNVCLIFTFRHSRGSTHVNIVPSGRYSFTPPTLTPFAKYFWIKG